MKKRQIRTLKAAKTTYHTCQIIVIIFKRGNPFLNCTYLWRIYYVFRKTLKKQCRHDIIGASQSKKLNPTLYTVQFLHKRHLLWEGKHETLH